VMVSTCLMGQTGRCAGMAGYGYHAAGVAGFFELAGWPDRAPVGPWNAYTDTIAPRFLTTTLLSALDHKRRTGEGQHIGRSLHPPRQSLP
jgi:benzylsuccinate CoA-transferase BbsF subunit